MQPDSFRDLENSLASGLDLSDELVESLSGLEDDALHQFEQIWRRLEGEQRAVLLDRLGEAAEENLTLDFSPLYGLALDDPDPVVRELGYTLAADEVDPDLLERYIRAAVSDSDVDVRVAALDGLGAYTLAAQVEDWPADVQNQLETTLVGALHLPGASLATRRAALLSLSYLTTPQAETEIRQAHLQPDLRDAAVESMGRNCQDMWIPDILSEMEADDGNVREAAAHAAAEMEDERLVPGLIGQLRDDDDDVRFAAVQALGAIGGEDAKAALGELLRSRDRELREAAKDAMEELLERENPLQQFGDS
jgi:HEAT repeat protein